MLSTTLRVLRAAAMVTLAGLCAAAVYQHSKGNIVAGIYRDRLREISRSYADLHNRYNQVVKKTAVTELVLENGRLNVVIRTADGVLETVPTDLDPAKEIHVEYVARNGRLWIRRVYTLTDPDGEGQADARVKIINPALADLPWTTDTSLQGLSVFRKELTPGRWVVTTTGNAALALVKLKPGQSSDLAGPPPVCDFREIQKEIHGEIDRLSPTEIIERMIAGTDGE